MAKILSNMNVRIPKSQRLRFRKKCKEHGLTVEFAVSQLLQKAIDGEVVLGNVETKLVYNEKQT